MIQQAMTDLQDQLTAAGVSACIDPRDLNPPAVWIRPPGIRYTFGGGAELSWDLVAAVPDSGTSSAVAALDSLLQAAQSALGGAVTAAARTEVPAAEGSPPLPAYRLIFTTDA